LFSLKLCWNMKSAVQVYDPLFYLKLCWNMKSAEQVYEPLVLPETLLEYEKCCTGVRSPCSP
jgi:hypothetical protein